jgi:hypothetical protein
MPRIRHYDHDHQSVDEVHACTIEHAAEVEDRSAEAPPSDRPTPKQVNFLKVLVERHEGHGITDIDEMVRLGQISKREASHLIDMLQALPKRATSPSQNGNGVSGGNGLRTLFEAVPDGRYAIDIDGTVKFYRVDTAQAGHRWIMVQASDDLHKLGFEPKKAALVEIAKDPKTALLRYGREIGRCGHCGRTLTNEESRELGIGPVCRANGSAWGF